MRSWYKIENKKEDMAEISIYQEIGESWFEESVTAKKFIKELKNIDAGIINLHINSPGGSVFDGLAIYNALKAHSAKIIVKIDGLAASIASVIAMAGDVIEMPKNTMMMIHDPSCFVGGSSSDMRKMANALDKIKTGIISTYQDKTGLAEDELAGLMAEETWFTAQEAINKGLADEMTALVPVQLCAGMDKYNFKNMPHQFKDINNNHKNIKEVPNMNVNDFKEKYPEIYKEVLNFGVKSCEIDAVANVQIATDTERARIKSVEAQLIPGHADLIEELKWDGKTTGEQAAMAVLQAEKRMRVTMQNDLDNDAVDAVIVDAVIVDTAIEKDLDFMTIVDNYKESINCSHGHAISQVAKDDPKAHASWIAKINGGK